MVVELNDGEVDVVVGWRLLFPEVADVVGDIVADVVEVDTVIDVVDDIPVVVVGCIEKVWHSR